MASKLITLPFRPTINLRGGVEAGAKLFVYSTGTTTPVSVYSDSALSIPLTNPVVADAFGVFPDVYYNDTQIVRVVIQQANGTVLSDTDPYVSDAASAEASADAAALSAAAAEAVARPIYANNAAGLAATTEGDFFFVDQGDGTADLYRHDAGPTATAMGRSTIINPQATGAAGLIGATGGSVQSLLDARPTSATLAGSGGAGLIGATGGNVQSLLDAQAAYILKSRQVVARQQLSWLPFEAVSDVYVGALIPTASTPVAAMRLHSEWILVRVRTTGLSTASNNDVYFNEYLYRDPAGYAQVNGGWQLVMCRGYANGRYINVFTAPDAPGQIPNADFAIRIGRMADAYVSSGDSGDWRYRGFGHGGMLNTPANNQISSDGAAGNLQTTGVWAVGATAYGTYFTIDCDYGLVLPPKTLGADPASTDGSTGTVTITYAGHGMSTGVRVLLSGITDTGGITQAQMTGVFSVTVVDANTFTIATAGTSTSSATGGGSAGVIEVEACHIDYTISHGAGWGRRAYIKQQYDPAFTPAVGFQDSYHVLFGVDPFEIDQIKPGGFNAEEVLLDGLVKSNSGAWHTGSGNVYQAYSDFEPSLIFKVTDEYGQPVRANDGSVSAFQFNTYARRLFADQVDYPKFYALFASSAEAPASRVAVQADKSIYYECQYTMAVVHASSGPA